nr:MAG TPA: hypothetical protein [Caudoviricetes sp.]
MLIFSQILIGGYGLGPMIKWAFGLIQNQFMSAKNMAEHWFIYGLFFITTPLVNILRKFNSI